MTKKPDIWLNRLLAKGIALHAPGSLAEKRELLEILGLIEPGGSVVLPDDRADYSDLANVSDAKIVQRDDIRVFDKKYLHLVPEGLRNLAPLPVEPVEKPGPQGGRPRKPENEVHGSHVGRRRHLQAKEPLCEPCRLFFNAWQRERRAAQKAEAAKAAEATKTGKLPSKQRSSCGTATGATLHRRKGEVVCEPCRLAHNAENRARHARRKLRETSEATCGTEAGASRHRYLGEPICPACQEAVDTAQRERGRIARMGMADFSPAECGSESGYRRHRRLKEPICGPCREAKNRAQRERAAAKRAAKQAEAQVVHVPGQLDIYEQEAS